MKFKHPELKVGEIFLQNDTRDGFELLDFATKRLGKIAYNIDNNPPMEIDQLFPVFVSESEVFKHPELRDGEVFLGNFTQEVFREIQPSSKRIGMVAYEPLTGKLVDERYGYFPVFVSREEWEKSL